MRPLDRAPLWVAGLCLLYVSGSPAVSVTLDANARLAEEFNTNLFLTPRPHNYAWGQGIDGGMNLSAIEGNWKSTLGANFFNRWYLTDRNLDYFNQFLNWKNSYYTTRSKFDLDVQYNNDTTLTSLADQTASFGYVFERVPRTDKVVSPRWFYSLSPRALLNVGYTYRDLVYRNAGTNATQRNAIFPDSYSHLGSVDLTYDWTPRLKIFGTSYYSYYALTYPRQTTSGSIFGFPAAIFSPSYTSDIQTANLSLGFRYLATETVDVNFSAGVQRNQTHRPAFTQKTAFAFADGSTQPGPDIPAERLSSNSLGEIFSLGVNKRLQTGSVGLLYNRTITPNLLGDLITFEQVTLTGRHQLSSALSSIVNLSYFDQIFPGGNSKTNQTIISKEITRFGLDSSVNWQFEQDWFLNASYRLNYVAYQSTDQSAISHGFYLYIQHFFDQQRL